MGDRGLLVAAHLGHRAVLPLGDEDRVVAEALRAAHGGGDGAGADARRDQHPVARSQPHEHADEGGAPVLDPLELLEQPAAVVGVGRLRAGVARAEDAGPPVERVHRQAGVVGHHHGVRGRLGAQRGGLDPGVLQERGPGLGGVEAVGRAAHLGAGEQRLELGDLVPVAGGEDDLQRGAPSGGRAGGGDRRELRRGELADRPPRPGRAARRARRARRSRPRRSPGPRPGGRRRSSPRSCPTRPASPPSRPGRAAARRRPCRR